MMKETWIQNYAGTWEDPAGHILVINVTDEHHATVTLLVDGEPMPRPWCGNDVARNLAAEYIPIDGPGLIVDLGRPGFSLELNYEFLEPWVPDEPEALSVSVSRYENDELAEGFIYLFMPLERYRKKSAEP